MNTTKELSPVEKEQVEERMKRFHKALKERPTISDEEFMAETGVSDEQYAIGLILPGVGRDEGGTHE